MKIKVKIFFLCFFLVLMVLTGCGKLADMNDTVTTPAPVVVGRDQETEEETGEEESLPQELQTEELVFDDTPERIPVKAKGIYISANVAGTPAIVDRLLEAFDRTEANTLVIDLKDDFGHVVCEMDSPLVQELGSVKVYVRDMKGLLRRLEEHGIYTIARIPAFRDAWLGDVRPEWCLKNGDGTLFRDRNNHVWVNPYRQEAWDYLVEISLGAKALGFKEVQFDYLRFCTEAGMQKVVISDEEMNGRSRTDIICQCMEYIYPRLKEKGLFVSADVYGAIINSQVNAQAVGQVYGELAKHVDYISPMIYPSHYGDGNYGIDYPDTRPYDTITAALEDSRKELYFAGQDGGHIAQVRPWLQDFTASWLQHYIDYGPEQVRAQIQATYDAGYDEWLLWDASCNYNWEALLTPEEAAREQEQILQSRAALPETTYAQESTRALLTVAPETGQEQEVTGGHELLTMASEEESSHELMTAVSEEESSRELLTVAPEESSRELLTVAPEESSREPLTVAPEERGQEPLTEAPGPGAGQNPAGAGSPSPEDSQGQSSGTQESGAGPVLPSAQTEPEGGQVIIVQPEKPQDPAAAPASSREVEVRILD